MAYLTPFESCGVGHLSAKSDVYSFGVVLLELLSGRRAIDKNRPSGEHNLVEWAKPYLANKRRVFRILDNRLEGQYALEVAQKVANLAARCLSGDPKFRPSMDDVVKELEPLKEQSKGKGNTHGNTSKGSRPRRRNAGDANASDAYPRPSASPLYAK